MADQEHGLESPDQGHSLCVNNCGFSGSPATQNMCPKCYIDLKRGGRLDVEPTRRPSPTSSTAQRDDGVERRGGLLLAGLARGSSSTGDVAARPAEIGSLQTTTGKCATCRKRIGLTGFRCRCGAKFCGVHRYPERHGCGFDYKAAGREAIAKENPIVKAEKLHYKI